MRTLQTEYRWATIVLTVLGCLTPALAHAEEPPSKLRQQALNLNSITGKDPQEREVQALLKDKGGAKKLVAQAKRMAAEKPQPFTYNATHILGIVALKLKDYRAAETFFRLHLEQAKQLRSTQGLIDAYGGLIDAVYANRKYAEAEKLCKEVTKSEIIRAAIQNLAEKQANLTAKKDALEDKQDADAKKEAQAINKELESIKNELTAINRFISSVLQEQIMAVARQGDPERSIEMIDRLLDEQSDGWLALDLKGRALRLADKNKEALKIYQDEMKRIQADNDLKKKDKARLIDDVRYSLSGVYIELGQVEKAAEQLQALLKKSPDNPTYNNDLGYIWADHNMHLSESEKLIRKALEDDRKQRQQDNPKAKSAEIKDRGAYLDSLGWVLYKQKKYAEAKKYLQQAVRNMMEEDESESIEIFDHLGDVLLALGEKKAAVAAWKKGLAVAGDSKREQKRKEEVQKKIKAHE